jgi:predicted GIY-YIG superfamily endonuclease
MEHICYVLYSKKYNKIYVGYTSSLIERIRSHNGENNKGSLSRRKVSQRGVNLFCINDPGFNENGGESGMYLA